MEIDSSTLRISCEQVSYDTTSDRFVHLEQVKDSGFNDTVTDADIQNMVNIARSGRSARSYKPAGCDSYIDEDSIVTDFKFYVWPSDIDLAYTVTTTLGDISYPSPVHKSVDISVTFGLTDSVTFDFLIEEIVSYSWETPCYNSKGEVVDDAELTLSAPSTIIANKPIFGVVRLNFIKFGNLHTLTTRLVKTAEDDSEESFTETGAGSFYTYQNWLDTFFGSTDAGSWWGGDPRAEEEELEEELVNFTGLSIDNLQVTVTSHWIDESGEEATESLQMEVSNCTKDLLSTCGIDTDGDGRPDHWGPEIEDDILRGGLVQINPDNDNPYDVYVSACSGKVISAVRQKDDENSWRSKS